MGLNRRLGPLGARSGVYPVLVLVICSLAVPFNQRSANGLIGSNSCPSASQLKSLQPSNPGVPQSSLECDCSSDSASSGAGWEVNCFREMTADEKEPSNRSSDYPFISLPLAFTVKYVEGKVVEITCGESAPDFKPAMFQGLGVDEVDAFRLINCPLPTLPLSVILHRTSIQTHFATNRHQVGAEGARTGADSIVSQVKSLKLESTQPLKTNSSALSTLFNGLESLEKLTLINILIEVPTAARGEDGSSREKENQGQRQKRNSATTSFPLTTSFASNLHPETGPKGKTTVDTTTESLRFETGTGAETSSVDTDLDILDPIMSSVNEKGMRGFSYDKSSSDLGLDLNEAPSNPSTGQSRAPSRLNFSFARFFPKLKSLLLENLFALESQFNAIYLKELLESLYQLEIIHLRANNLLILPNHLFNDSAVTLSRVYLIGNNITELEPYVFANLKKVEILDLFNNELKSLSNEVLRDLPNLRHLRIGRNRLTSLPERLLSSNRELMSLDLNLSHNLTAFPSSLLIGLNSLQNFSCVDCFLRRLALSPETFFSFAINLEKIDLRNNRLQNLTAPNMFGLNPKLSKIDLSFNDITVISPDVFSFNSSSLRELNLYGNNLVSIDAATFSHLMHLKILNLGFNNLKEISAEHFYKMRKLEELDLSKNALVSVNPRKSRVPFGLGSDKLRKINLSHNNITDFDDFSVIEWSLYLSISEINLSSNKILGEVILPIFYSTSPAVVLDLSSNLIASVNMNDVLQYESTVLAVAKDPKSELNEVRKVSFRSSLSQVIVHLDENPLQCDCHLEPFLKYAKSSATDFEATFRGILNKISFDFHSPNLRCNKPHQLSGRPLSQVHVLDLTCLISDSRICPHGCSCLYRAHDEQAIINCSSSGLERLPDAMVTPSSYKSLKLASNASVASVKGITFQLDNNKLQDVSQFSKLFRGVSAPLSGRRDPLSVELFLDNNAIETIPPELLGDASMHANASASDAVEKSYSSHKHTAIKVLSLRHNLLQRIPVQFMDHFTYRPTGNESETQPPTLPFKLFLGHNPYNCTPEKAPVAGQVTDCHMIGFKSWLTTNYPVIGDINEITCDWVEPNDPSLTSNTTISSQSRQSTVIVQMPDSLLCPQLAVADQQLLLTLTIVCVILALNLFVVSVLYYRNKQTVLAFIYIHFNPIFICLNFSENDLDEEKLYDAFLSYSSADRDVVMQLIEKLEKPSDLSYTSISFLQQQLGLPSIHEGNSDQLVPELCSDIKDLDKSFSSRNLEAESDADHYTLCIHERDWLPGNLISWNIVNSVQNSRRTVLILSKEFIQSIWFQVEFHTAYYQMLEDKMDRLIVIVKGELPPRDQLDKDLVFLLTTKTYLVWGEKWFWEKLKYALPHKRSRSQSKSHGLRSQQALSGSHSKSKSHLSTNNGMGPLSPASKTGSKPSKAEVMKEYVDQTIANHFQLQRPTQTSTPLTLQRNGNHQEHIFNQSNIYRVTPINSSNLKSNGSENRDQLNANGKPVNTVSVGQVNETFVIETET